ncbi:MAG: hypothetical protein KKA44_00090 [Alphaproteobacteria bacterium]|nr:hypothetical protein [Alphaproteobacteria bacterium]MBU0863474.1 hypothetical protein [Alphaproteobacteria bacterium]MBU1823364.1 hypothetical protein [Alphaproteobacteria bacterium]
MSHYFRIVAVPDPQTLPRIAGIFAQRSLIPSMVSAQLRGGLFNIEVALDDLDAQTAAIITAKLRESVLIASAVCDPADKGTRARHEAAAA